MIFNVFCLFFVIKVKSIFCFMFVIVFFWFFIYKGVVLKIVVFCFEVFFVGLFCEFLIRGGRNFVRDFFCVFWKFFCFLLYFLVNCCCLFEIIFKLSFNFFIKLVFVWLVWFKLCLFVIIWILFCLGRLWIFISFWLSFLLVFFLVVLKFILVVMILRS